MPIRAENKARYPKDWKAISIRIRERAGQKCEKCKAPNGQLIIREQSEDYHFEPTYITMRNEMFSAEDGRLIGGAYFAERDTSKAVNVVLTVAHLDHTPENCADDNLRAWCQRCHNAYDAPMRASGVAARRKAIMAAGDLFGVQK